MIFDTLSSIDRYSGLGERFQLAFNYLRQHGAATDRTGTVAIRGEEVYAMHQTYQTKPSSELKWEAHQKYADVQFVGSGQEAIGHAFLDRMKVSEPYDPAKEAAFFTGEGIFLNLVAGDFTVFFPHDVHMPTAAPASGPGPVRKIVIKVRI